MLLREICGLAAEDQATEQALMAWSEMLSPAQLKRLPRASWKAVAQIGATRAGALVLHKNQREPGNWSNPRIVVAESLGLFIGSCACSFA